MTQVEVGHSPASWRCIIRGGVGANGTERMFDGSVEGGSVEEVLGDIKPEIDMVGEKMLKAFNDRIKCMADAERRDFKRQVVETLELHEKMREEGYEHPGLYKSLDLPVVWIKIFHPNSDDVAHTETTYFGLNELGIGEI